MAIPCESPGTTPMLVKPPLKHRDLVAHARPSSIDLPAAVSDMLSIYPSGSYLTKHPSQYISRQSSVSYSPLSISLSSTSVTIESRAHRELSTFDLTLLPTFLTAFAALICDQGRVPCMDLIPFNAASVHELTWVLQIARDIDYSKGLKN